MPRRTWLRFSLRTTLAAMSFAGIGLYWFRNRLDAAASQYLEAGNFLFLTANYQLPYYTQFGTTQSLFYFTAEELDALRAAPVASSPRVPTVTAAFFNPAGQLPLRFAPTGYVEAG